MPRAALARLSARRRRRSRRREPKLAAEVEAWLAQAEAEERAGDALHGGGLRGDETPA